MSILSRATHLRKIPLAKHSLEHGYDELWDEVPEDRERDELDDGDDDDFEAWRDERS